MAIVVNKHTKIESISECPFDHKAPSKRFTKINNIDDISDFTLVSIIGKLHIRSQQSEVKVQERSVMKLDCNIGDDTGAIKLTLWDKYIPLVQEGQVYEIVNARARGLFLAWVGREWPLFLPRPNPRKRLLERGCLSLIKTQLANLPSCHSYISEPIRSFYRKPCDIAFQNANTLLAFHQCDIGLHIHSCE